MKNIEILLKNDSAVQCATLDASAVGAWLDKPEINVFVDPQEEFQQFLGFGGSFSELGYKALLSLGKEEREEVICKLFGKDESGLNYCRIPIGANDFALDAYSPNDCQGDYSMEHFSLTRDKQYLIPFIKDAQKQRPELAIHACPWSPPGWMKEGGLMDQAAGHLKEDDKTLAAYAQYFVRFVEEYAALGIPIFRVLIQNEPDTKANFPGNYMPPHVMRRFFKEFLNPAMQNCEIPCEVYAGTFRGSDSMWANDVARDKDFLSAIDGFGFQYTPPERLHDFIRVTDKPIMHTESNCYDGSNSWEQAFSLFVNFIGYVNSGCEIYTYWNMVLNEDALSSWGWKQNSLVTVNEESGKTIYNPDYHVARLISRAASGRRRVFSLCERRMTIAFKGADGDISVLMPNFVNHSTTVNLSIEGKILRVELPSNSANAIHLKKDGNEYILK